jgi:two-component system LytT family response regulator
MLEQRFSELCKVVCTTTDALQVPSLLHMHQPEILFLDVEMPRLSGLDVLKMIPDRKCEVVFTTAYTQYAVEAIRLQAADYLVKPFSIDELADALQRCREKLSINTLLKKGITAGAPLRFAITAQNGVHLIVGTDDMLWIEAESNYSVFHFTNRPKVVVSKTLKEFEEQLSPHGFFRAHSSSLINLSHVKSFHAQGGDDYLMLSNNIRVPLSRRRKAVFFACVQKI